MPLHFCVQFCHPQLVFLLLWRQVHFVFVLYRQQRCAQTLLKHIVPQFVSMAKIQGTMHTYHDYKVIYELQFNIRTTTLYTTKRPIHCTLTYYDVALTCLRRCCWSSSSFSARSCQMRSFSSATDAFKSSTSLLPPMSWSNVTAQRHIRKKV